MSELAVILQRTLQAYPEPSMDAPSPSRAIVHIPSTGQTSLRRLCASSYVSGREPLGHCPFASKGSAATAVSGASNNNSPNFSLRSIGSLSMSVPEGRNSGDMQSAIQTQTGQREAPWIAGENSARPACDRHSRGD
jgi:hypothetical protein